eukprot:8188761-Pyramimonas_sp.AAC.1
MVFRNDVAQENRTIVRVEMGGSLTFRDLRDHPLDWIGSTPKRLVLSATGCARRANSWGAARKRSS